MKIDLTKEEMENVIDYIEERYIDGYLNAEDPAMYAIEKLKAGLKQMKHDVTPMQNRKKAAILNFNLPETI